MKFFIALMLFVSIGVACTSQITPPNPVTPPNPNPVTPPNPTTPSVAIPNPVPANQTWEFCSKQYSNCDFSGLRDVRFGHGDTWIVKEFYNSTNTVGSCREVTFGLPSDYYDPESYCEVSTHIKTGTLAAPVMEMGPRIDLTKIPLGSKGTSQARIAQASSDPSLAPTKHNDSTSGEFRTHCDYSHMNFDDPIVYPGQVGRSHLHTFFGNTRTWAGSTALSIAETGNSTCAGGITNRTAYWVPTLIDTKDGRPLAPEDSIWYYKNGWSLIPAKDIKPIPKGLRMIAGNMKSSQAEDSAYTGWSCWNGGGNGHSIPTTCAVGDYVVMNVNFPQCWNGKDLDSSDHKSHMAYPELAKCPASHPVPIPAISLNLKYKVIDPSAPARWRLSSDMYDTSKPGGFSAHADWFDGWDENIKNTWVQNCNVAGFDCHAFLLGDGRTQY